GIAPDGADGKNRDASNACEPGEFHPVSSSNTPGRRVLSRSTLGRRPPPPRPEGGLAPSGALPFGLSMRRWGRIDPDGDRGVARLRGGVGRVADNPPAE